MILLAKSHPKITVSQHLRDTDATGMALYNARYFDALISQLNIDDNIFKLHLRISCLLHDLGKINEDFQNYIRLIGTDAAIYQRIRHEHVSVALIAMLEDWFCSGQEAVSVKVLMGVILGHHLKSPRTKENHHFKFGEYDIPEPGKEYLGISGVNDPSIRGIFGKIANIIKTPQDQTDQCTRPKRFVEQIQIPSKVTDSDPFKKAYAIMCGLTTEDNKMVNALKTALILSDSIASFLPSEIETKDNFPRIKQYVDSIVTDKISSNEIQRAIIAPQLVKIKSLNDMQNNISLYSESQSPNRVLLINSCGSGKTLAAWEWAKHIAEKSDIHHVIFAYPTKAATYEGWKNYLPNTDDSAILHSTADLDIQKAIQEEPDSFDKFKPLITKDVLEKLQYKYISTTLDQFAFMHYVRCGILRAPMMYRSAVIFDEVHSYDGKMLKALFSFIENSSVPILIMSATIPEPLKKEFLKLGFVIKPDSGLAQIEQESNYIRYNINHLPSIEEAKKKAIEAFRAGKKVLFITNRVGPSKREVSPEGCQDTFLSLRKETGNILCYHSRFKEYHKNSIHSETISGFKDNKPFIAVTTQVCEMSLDIDADVLITALAPSCSLIQRLGRACRNRQKYGTQDRVSDVFIYDISNVKPYEDDDMFAAKSFVKSITGKKSQQNLADALYEVTKKNFISDKKGSVPFFEAINPMYTYPSSLREEDGFMVPAIINTDIPLVKNGSRIDRAKLNNYILKVPVYSVGWNVDPSLPHIRVYDEEYYDEDIGFTFPLG